MSDTTATEPGTGVIHELDGDATKCGKDAKSWSREVTVLQRLGLIVACEACKGNHTHKETTD